MRTALLFRLCYTAFGVCWWDGTTCDCTINCADICTDPWHCVRPNCSNTGTVNCCQCNWGFYPNGLACSSCPNQCPWAPSTVSYCICSCDPTCLKCQTNASTCVTATPGCDSSCKTCSATAPFCASCYSYSSLSSGLCVCNPGYFGTAPLCQACSLPCKECSSTANYCTACYSVATASGGVCTCPVGHTADPMDCQVCDLSCTTCAASGASQCLSCASTFSLAGTAPSKCICPFGTYLSAVPSCLPCHVYCLTCSGPASGNCLSCNYGATLSGPSPNSCVCLPPTTTTSSPDQCSACASTCVSCANDADTGCVTCFSNALVMYPPGPCVCMPGFFPSPGSAHCQACSAVCSGCFGPREDQCNACKTHAILQGSQCACDINYQSNPDASNCVYLLPPLTENSPPIPQLSASLQVLLNNSLALDFTSTLKSELQYSDLTLEVLDVSDGDIPLRWTLQPRVKSLSYSLNLTFVTILPGNTSEVTLLFPDNSKIQSIQGAHLNISTLTGLLHPLPAKPTSGISLSSQAATTAAAASQTAIAASTLSSLINGSPSNFWSLLNQLQLITYIPLSTLPIPPRFASTLAALNVNSFLTNPFSYAFQTHSYGNCTSVNAFAENYGIETSLLLLNAGIMFTAAVTCVCSYLSVYLVSKYGFEWLRSYFAQLLVSFRWGIFLRYWLQVYMDVGLYSLLQLSTLSGFHCFSHIGFLINVALACLFAAMSFITPLLLMFFILKNRRKIANRSDFNFNLTWGVLFLDLHATFSASSLLYYSIFLLRRLALSLTLIFFSSSSGFQAFVMTFMEVFVRLTGRCLDMYCWPGHSKTVSTNAQQL